MPIWADLSLYGVFLMGMCRSRNQSALSICGPEVIMLAVTLCGLIIDYINLTSGPNLDVYISLFSTLERCEEAVQVLQGKGRSSIAMSGSVRLFSLSLFLLGIM